MANYYLDLPLRSVGTLTAPGLASTANQALEIAELEEINANTTSLKVVIDGVVYAVKKDTGIPSNTVAIPVELSGASGPINITAGDLNVQLSDQGANADVTRIGDGTNQLGINASKEALVLDSDLNLAIGEKTDAVATTDVGDFSLISLTKKVAKNISELSTPTVIPLVGVFDEILALTTVQTFTAPAKAVSANIMAMSSNAGNIRFKQNGVATTTSGLLLEPGRSETLLNVSNVSVCSESGTNEVAIIWNTQP